MSQNTDLLDENKRLIEDNERLRKENAEQESELEHVSIKSTSLFIA